MSRHSEEQKDSKIWGQKRQKRQRQEKKKSTPQTEDENLKGATFKRQNKRNEMKWKREKNNRKKYLIDCKGAEKWKQRQNQKEQKKQTGR